MKKRIWEAAVCLFLVLLIIMVWIFRPVTVESLFNMDESRDISGTCRIYFDEDGTAVNESSDIEIMVDTPLYEEIQELFMEQKCHVCFRTMMGEPEVDVKNYSIVMADGTQTLILSDTSDLVINDACYCLGYFGKEQEQLFNELWYLLRNPEIAAERRDGQNMNTGW